MDIYERRKFRLDIAIGMFMGLWLFALSQIVIYGIILIILLASPAFLGSFF